MVLLGLVVLNTSWIALLARVLEPRLLVWSPLEGRVVGGAWLGSAGARELGCGVVFGVGGSGFCGKRRGCRRP